MSLQAERESIIPFLAGAVTGAVLIFLFDPQQGRGRRSYLRDKGVHFSKIGARSMRKTTTHWGNRLQGLRARAGWVENQDRDNSMAPQI